jgi:hypothetical protein
MRKRVLLDLVIIFLIGLLPILWLPGETMLFGHDAGYPFDPITHFQDRFSVWSQRLGIGTDQSYGLLGALPIHGLQAFLVWIGLSFKTAQLVDFIFWFALPGFTMYFFAYKMWPEKRYLPLISALVYMINFYLLQAWFVSEQTKFSIYSALPLVAYFTFFLFAKRISLLKAVLGTGITLGILNGGGSFPLYGGLIIFFSLWTIYFNFINRSIQVLKKTVLYFVGVGILYILLSAYWLFPYIYYILGFYSRDLALAGGAEGAIAWATYLSKGTSFINLFRGHGVPEWYLNQFHAYASNYLSNPLLIIVSFMLPIIAYFSLFLIKDNKDKLYIFFFAILSLVTLVFAAGPGSQLGIVFESFTRYVPGFAIFRSAYYKFDYTFYLAYGILIGFTLNWVLTRLEQKLKSLRLSTFPVAALLIILVLGYIVYHSPYLDGSFLDYSKEPGRELSNRITVPKYVFEFGNWSNKQDITKRYLVVPELSPTGFVSFKWGYWSYAPISSLQTSTSFVQNTFLISQSERFLMNKIYESLLKGDVQSFKDFTEVFAIDGILLQKDFDWENRFWGTTDPKKYERILNNNQDFKLVETFGEWKVYDIVDRNKSLRVTAAPRLSFLHGELSNIVSFPQFDSKTPLFMDDASSKDSAYFINEATDVFLSPDCVSCNLEPVNINFKYYNPKILPGSFLYPLITFRENLVRKSSKDFNSYLNYLLTASDRRIIEGKWMIDSKTKLNYVEDAFRAYYNSLLELDRFINRENWGVTSRDENIAAQTVAAHLEQEAILIESVYDNNLNNINTRTILADAYDELLKLYDLVQKRIWITPNTQEKRYLFDLPRLGTYNVYVKENSLADSSSLSRSSAADGLTLNIPKENKTLKLASRENGWVNFGRVEIKDKILKISLKDSTVKNLLDGVSAILPDDPGFKIDNGVYTLTADSQNKCFYFPLNNLETVNTQYMINFSYRNFTDKIDLGFIAAEPGVNIPKLSVKSTFLQNSPQWLKNSIVLPRERYVITPRNPDLNIYFCNGFSTLKESSSREGDEFIIPGQDVLQIKDITVNKISIPSIVLHQREENIEDAEFVSGFIKPNTVEYKVNIKPTNNPVTLVMRESYGKYWKACEEGGKCFSFEDKNHFASAGFENAWYFKDGIKGNISLYYYPQRVYTIGMYITLGSFVLLAVGCLWLKFIKKEQ